MSNRITVIGMGAMGRTLAATLIGAGYDVTVWNRSPGKAAALASRGARIAQSAAGAIAASPVVVTCVSSHVQTLGILSKASGALAGKTVIETSTGGAAEAEALAAMLSEAGADWLIAIINGFPDGIGKPDTVLSVVGDRAIWNRHAPLIRALGGASEHVGEAPGMAAALFAALFTARQGFMWGMIFGGLLCRRAGIPLEVFARQLPVSMGVLPAYYRYFADTVPTGSYDNPPSTAKVYAGSFDDALATFRALGAADDLPKLFSDFAHRAVDAGAGDKALTVLVELLDTPR